MRNTKWPPGGHIIYQIGTKINRAPPHTSPTTSYKFGINPTFLSQVTVQNVKYKMADWRPYCFLDRNQIGHLPTPASPHHTNLGSIRPCFLKIQSGMQITRWQPGGHIVFRNGTKIDRAPPHTSLTTPYKFGINLTLLSEDTVWNAKYKMAAWRPYCFSERDQNQ